MNLQIVNKDTGEVLDDEAGSRQEQAIRILEFLNQKSGRKFRTNANTLKPIVARLNEGFTVAECKQVIVRKCRDWSGVTFGNGQPGKQYLSPFTLFAPTNFNNYVADL
jgi:uncharacterized phage protein (TIGR02220 family)